MKRASCARRSAPTTSVTVGGQVGRRDDAGVDRVLEVVADVGDAVGPGHHLALGRDGGGRFQEWLRMASSVSAHRLSGARTTSAP